MTSKTFQNYLESMFIANQDSCYALIAKNIDHQLIDISDFCWLIKIFVALIFIPTSIYPNNRIKIVGRVNVTTFVF